MSSEQAAAAIQDLAGPASEDTSALAEDLRCLRVLLEDGNVEGARRLIADMAPRWPDAAEVQHFARVLASPKARWVPGKRGRSMAKDFAWLREHAREYQGQWVAVYDGRLIANAPRLAAVRERLRELPDVEGALLHRVP